MFHAGHSETIIPVELWYKEMALQMYRGVMAVQFVVYHDGTEYSCNINTLWYYKWSKKVTKKIYTIIVFIDVVNLLLFLVLVLIQD